MPKLPALHVTSAVLGGALAIIFAAVDLWVFHSLAATTDLTFLLAGLGAFGVTGAYSAGLNSDPVTSAALPSNAPTPQPVPPAAAVPPTPPSP